MVRTALLRMGVGTGTGTGTGSLAVPVGVSLEVDRAVGVARLPTCGAYGCKPSPAPERPPLQGRRTVR